MLSDTLFRVARTEGLHTLQRRGEHGARELTTRRLTLSRGGAITFGVPDEETVVVLLEGRGDFGIGGRSWPVERADVFTAPPTAVYLPRGVAVHVRADTALEAVLVSTPVQLSGEPGFCSPADVSVVERGADLYKRSVRNVFVGDPHARRLMVGETVNVAGHWSSYPPHKHDGVDGELRLEEMYYYRIRPAEGFGIHLLYTASGESATHQVRDGDAVLIPYGYHTVSAPPRYEVYYLWAIAGDERTLAVYEDPAHRWVHEAT